MPPIDVVLRAGEKGRIVIQVLAHLIRCPMACRASDVGALMRVAGIIELLRARLGIEVDTAANERHDPRLPARRKPHNSGNP